MSTVSGTDSSAAAAHMTTTVDNAAAYKAVFHSGALVVLLSIALRPDLKQRRLRDDQRDVMMTVIRLLRIVRACLAMRSIGGC